MPSYADLFGDISAAPEGKSQAYSDSSYNRLFGDISSLQPAAKPEPSSLWREFPAAVGRGILGRATEMAGQALQWSGEAPKGEDQRGSMAYEIGESLRNVGKMYGESEALKARPEGHGSIANTISEGLEMIGPSVAPMALSLIPGMQGPAALTGIAALGAGMFGASTAQDTYERGKAAGLTDEQARDAAWKTGTIEATGEFVGTWALGKFFGLAGRRIANATGKSAVDGVLEAYRNPQVLKEFGKGLAKTYGIEIGTEVSQNVGEAMVERAADIPGPTPTEAGLQAIGPTAVMTTVMAPFGLVGRGGLLQNAKDRSLIASTIEDPNADPKDRAFSASVIGESLKEVDPAAAEAWKQNTSIAIANRQPIALSEEVTRPQVGGEGQPATMDEAIADQANQRISQEVRSQPTVDQAIATAEAAVPDVEAEAKQQIDVAFAQKQLLDRLERDQQEQEMYAAQEEERLAAEQESAARVASIEQEQAKLAEEENRKIWADKLAMLVQRGNGDGAIAQALRAKLGLGEPNALPQQIASESRILGETGAGNEGQSGAVDEGNAQLPQAAGTQEPQGTAEQAPAGAVIPKTPEEAQSLSEQHLTAARNLTRSEETRNLIDQELARRQQSIAQPAPSAPVSDISAEIPAQAQQVSQSQQAPETPGVSSTLPKVEEPAIAEIPTTPTEIPRFALGRMIAGEIGQSSLRPTIHQIRAAAEKIGVKIGDAQRALAVFNDPDGGGIAGREMVTITPPAQTAQNAPQAAQPAPVTTPTPKAEIAQPAPASQAQLGVANESDQERSEREWAENYSRVVGEDLKNASTKDLYRAGNYASAVLQRLGQAAQQGKPYNKDLYRSMKVERDAIAAEWQSRPDRFAQPSATSDAPGAAQSVSPKLQAIKAERKVDERLSNPDIRSELEVMAKEAGWAEVGGRLIRSGEGASADEIRAGRAHEAGQVTGRTSWVPRAWWWSNRPKPGLNEKQTQEAVRKALAGEPLNAKETRTINYMIESAQQTIEDFAAQSQPSEEFLPEALEEAGIDDLPPDEAEAAIQIADDVLPELRSENWSTMTEEDKESELNSIFGRATAESPKGSAETRAPEARPALSLESQTAEDLASREEAVRSAEAAKAKADAAAEAQAQAERERKEIAQRSEAVAGENFLTPSEAVDRKTQAQIDAKRASDQLAGQKPLFSRNAPSASIPLPTLRAVVERVSSAFPKAPEVEILASTQDAPDLLRAQINSVQGTVQAAWWRGKVYAFQENLSDEAEVEKAILHEFGHDGLRKLFGKDLDAVLDEIWRGSKKVRQEVAKMREKYKDLDRLSATEEYLANVAGTGERPGVLRRLIAAIRDFLRQRGFVSEFSDNDILSLVEASRGALTGERLEFSPAFGRQAKFIQGEPHGFWRKLRELGRSAGRGVRPAAFDSATLVADYAGEDRTGTRTGRLVGRGNRGGGQELIRWNDDVAGFSGFYTVGTWHGDRFDMRVMPTELVGKIPLARLYEQRIAHPRTILTYSLKKVSGENNYELSVTDPSRSSVAYKTLQERGMLKPLGIKSEGHEYGAVKLAPGQNKDFLNELARRFGMSEGHAPNLVIPYRDTGATPRRPRYISAARVEASFQREDQIRFQRAEAVERPIMVSAGNLFRDITKSDRVLNRVISKFNTPFHIAETQPQFKPVYDEAQASVQDTSRFANAAADLAKDLLPRIESVWDALPKWLGGKGLESPKQQDIERVADAVYAGTLFGGGNPMEGRRWTDEELRTGKVIETGRRKLTARESASGVIEEGGERRNLTQDEIDAGYAEGATLRLDAGFTPLNDAQIALYKQNMESIAYSLREHSKALIWRLAGKQNIQLDREMSFEDVAEIARREIEEKASELGATLEDLTDEDRINAEAEAAATAVEGDPRDPRGERAAAKVRAEAKREAAKVKAQMEELEALGKDIDAIETKTEKLIAAGYAPLMRFGKYGVNVQRVNTDGTKEELFFGRYETQVAANAAARELKAEYPDADVRSDVMADETYKLFQGLNLDALELFADQMTDEEGRAIGKDPLMQEFFRVAAAERSALKRQIHRKGTAGFSRDMTRALAQFTVSMAQATSRTYHGSEMLRLVQDIRSGDLKNYATRYVRYLQDPQEEAHALRGWLANYYILGSLAFGAVNMTQPVLITGPYLTQFTSYRKAMAALGKAALDYSRKSGMTDAERKAYDRASQEGVVSPQEIHQLRADSRASMLGDSALWNKLESALGAHGVKVPGRLALRKAAFLWGSIYSLTEQFNRGTTFLAAYRLGIENRVADPYAFAKEAVEATQFTYNRANRNEASRGPIGSVVMCVDDKTEALTQSGWKGIDELKIGDVIASFDMGTERMVWKPVVDVFRAPHDGEMVQVKGKMFDILMTPEHRNIVYRKRRVPGRRATNRRFQHLEIQEATALANHDEIPVAAPFIHKPKGRGLSDAMVRVLGWVFTEGCYYPNGEIRIYQNEGANANAIRSALRDAGIAWKEGVWQYENGNAPHVRFSINRTMAKAIRKEAIEKQLSPALLLRMSVRQIKLLIETMIRGDGHVNKKTGQRQFIQNAGETLDAFQMALTMVGESYSVAPHGPNTFIVSIRKWKKHTIAGCERKTVHYSGRIWCPRVSDTSTWLARRNGRPFITHNTFKTFNISYLELAKRLYKTDKKAFGALMLTLFVLAGAEGLPLAEDIQDLIDTIGQWLGYSTNSKKKLRQLATSLVGKDMANFVLHGTSAIPGMPIDIANRMGMHNIIPGTAMAKVSEPDKTRDILELLGPAATLFKNAGYAAQGVATGQPGELMLLAPIAIQNVGKGVGMLESGTYKDARGRKIMDVSTADAVFKAIGFQPESVAASSRVVTENQQDITLAKTVEAAIADNWAHGIVNREPDLVTRAKQQLKDWNEKNPETPISLRQGQIQRRIKEMMMSRESRFIKTAPKELRGGIREDMR